MTIEDNLKLSVVFFFGKCVPVIKLAIEIYRADIYKQDVHTEYGHHVHHAQRTYSFWCTYKPHVKWWWWFVFIYPINRFVIFTIPSRVVFVLTDGQSNDGGSPLQVAASLKNTATVFAIGLGEGISEAELIGIASSPAEDHVFLLSLLTDVQRLATQVTGGKSRGGSIVWGWRGRIDLYKHYVVHPQNKDIF